MEATAESREIINISGCCRELQLARWESIVWRLHQGQERFRRRELESRNFNKQNMDKITLTFI